MLLLQFLLIATAVAFDSESTTTARIACKSLKSAYPNLMVLPDDARYQNETQVSWSSAAWLKPACVVVPADATTLSTVLQKLVRWQVQFAMRGGGHMPISDAANIGSSGVLISSTNLNQLRLSKDRLTMSIGPGNRWGDVYEYLDGTNLTVVGGRLGVVGVPGLLLGGGISFYSYQHGLASTAGKIRAYEIVLADGSIVTATASNKYADLYWALQGGGNNFGLVTRFDLKTFYAPTPLSLEASYGTSKSIKKKYLDSVQEFVATGDVDPFAAITPVCRWGPNFTSPEYDSTLFYNGSSIPFNSPFLNFVNSSLMPLNNSKLAPITLAQMSKQIRPAFASGGQGYGFRQRFHLISARGKRDALDVIHDTFFGMLNSSGIANTVPGFFTGLAFNPMTKNVAHASLGSVFGLPIEPSYWVEQSYSWSNKKDDHKIDRFIVQVNSRLRQQLKDRRLLGRYNYLNDADAGQEVFKSYGQRNYRKLREIRDRYDPRGIFTTLMPGGFKLLHED